MWKCPECNEEIESLNYRVSTVGTESGSCSIKTYRNNTEATDYESDDHSDEWDGDFEYFCPECNEEINLSDIQSKEEEKEEESGRLEENENSKNINKKTIEGENQEGTDIMLKTANICPKCKYYFPRSEKEEYNYKKKEENIIECPECGIEFDENKEEKKNIKRGEKGKRIIVVKHKTKSKYNAKRIQLHNRSRSRI